MATIIRNEDLDEDAIRNLTEDAKDWIYNALDCCVTFEVRDQLRAQLDNVAGATYAFSRSLMTPIFEMSLRGTRINIETRNETLRLYEEQAAKVAANLERILSEGIGIKGLNWNSPAQVCSLFYDVMGYNPIRKRNAQGRMVPTANREAIEKLSQYWMAEPICNHLLKLREVAKKTAFLKTKLDPDGRIRANFNIAGTNTGRLASSMSDMGTGTNLQNIDKELRRCFEADPGMKLANLDLEQADARNVGAICWNLFLDSHGPEWAGAYLDACESGDLHTRVCQMAWRNLPWPEDPAGWRAIADQVAYRDMTYRDLAKRLGHGTNYLGTPPTMAKHTKVNRQLIEDFQNRYFRGFPCIKAWHHSVQQSLKNDGHITTLLGRRRHFFGRDSDASTLREAVAYEPQSLTADEIDTGILRLWRNPNIQLLIQVHDSILFQYPEELEDEIVPWALEQLKTHITLKGGRNFVVPTEAKIGWNWGDVGFDKKGNVIDNPHGLIKYKGGDKRTRPATPAKSLREMVCGS